MKRFTIFMFVLLASMASVIAKGKISRSEGFEYFPYYKFVAVQAGGQTTLTNYDLFKLATPTASVSAGVFFTPMLGTRLHVNGMWDKGAWDKNGYDFKYNYKYMTTDLDLMFNVVPLFNKGHYSPYNLYLIGGVGLNYMWDNDDAYAHKGLMPLAQKDGTFSHNFRLATQFDYNITKNVSINLEIAANSLKDRFNSKQGNRDDWQLTAQVGVAYKFGYRKAKAQTTVDDEIDVKPETSNVNTNNAKPVVKEEPKPAPVVKDDTKRVEIFYAIRESEIVDSEMGKIAEMAAWLKSHPEAKATVTGYADRGTGNPTINKKYAKSRADVVTKTLVKKYGIAASRITTDSKGDTVQPFSENDKNRVTIVVGQN